MSVYRTIPDSIIEPGKPVTTGLILSLVDRDGYIENHITSLQASMLSPSHRTILYNSNGPSGDVSYTLTNDYNYPIVVQGVIYGGGGGGYGTQSYVTIPAGQYRGGIGGSATGYQYSLIVTPGKSMTYILGRGGLKKSIYDSDSALAEDGSPSQLLISDINDYGWTALKVLYVLDQNGQAVSGVPTYSDIFITPEPGSAGTYDGTQSYYTSSFPLAERGVVKEEQDGTLPRKPSYGSGGGTDKSIWSFSDPPPTPVEAQDGAGGCASIILRKFIGPTP